MRLDDGDILKALHEGLFEQPLWSTFLDKLRARSGARYASLVFRPEGEESLVILVSGDPASERPPRDLQAAFAESFARDPLPYRQMREGRIYALDELVDPANPLHRAFRDDRILPSGMANLRTVRVSEPNGIDAWLSCAGGRRVGSSVSALLAALVPHLRIALR